VNDFYYDINVPHWLEHAIMGEDLLGFSDVIFPAFLFAVGLSIPIALEKRFAKGDSHLKISWYILLRTLALIVMGLFTLNYILAFNYNNTSAISKISIQGFGILMVIGFFLIWNVYPKAIGWKKYIFIALQIIGMLLLIYLAIIFRDRHGNIIKIHNWDYGVLAKIGWTYLTCTIIYMVVRKRLNVMLIILAAFFFYRLCAYRIGFWDYIPGNGAYHCFTMSGIIVSLLCDKYKYPAQIKKLFAILIGAGVTMLFIGIIEHNIWIISKLADTPPFISICIGISVLLYTFLYWLTDIKRKDRWFNIVKPAGTATLTCYLLPFLTYSIFSICKVKFPELVATYPIGLIKSIVFSLMIIWLAALLGKIHIKIKI